LRRTSVPPRRRLRLAPVERGAGEGPEQSGDPVHREPAPRERLGEGVAHRVVEVWDDHAGRHRVIITSGFGGPHVT